MRSVVIAAYGRTPFSRARPKETEKDPFSIYTAEELLAGIMPEILSRARVGADEPDNFLVGCALGVGEQWTFGGRTTSLLAGLSPKVPARFLDMQCGSGMAAVQSGFMEIASGQADIVVAAGMEHMTRVPVGPRLFNDGVMQINAKVSRKTAEWDMVTGLNMGLTAELLARQGGYSRTALDDYSVRSHHCTAAALDRGFFREEIIPVTGQDAQEKPCRVDNDQSLRRETDRAGLAQLKPVFKEDGVITAGNSSPLNAGAAALVLMNEETARAKAVTPLARIVATGCAGVRPELMGEGPIPASARALKNAGLTVKEIDCWEINEAFSVVVLNAVEKLGLDMDAVNANGGALAIGHPLGATGVRLVGTLARTLQLSDKRRGCATACVGGGQGIATLIEKF